MDEKGYRSFLDPVIYLYYILICYCSVCSGGLLCGNDLQHNSLSTRQLEMSEKENSVG